MFRKADFLLLGIALGLTLFGLAMVGSVSVFESYRYTSYQVSIGAMAVPSNSFFLWRSFLNVLLSLCGLAVASGIPYHFWERHARSLFIASLVLLIALFIPTLGNEYGTAKSWLQLPFRTLQPSEFLKLSLIFYLAVWLQKKEAQVGTLREGFLPFVALLTLSTFLVAIQPDLGSFLVFSVIATTMFFVAGGNIFHILLGAATAGLLGLPIILNKEYVSKRFEAFFTVLLHPNDLSIRENIGYQIYQALIAIGSGGLFGVGYGKSIQKFGYLPEVQSDTIFAAMAEELGFFRLLIVIGLYTILVYRGYLIARNAPDRFGFLIAAGITTWIAFQTLLNISVNLSLFPLTGLTLPFISYGGSSLFSVLFGVGILLNISMHGSVEDLSVRRRSSLGHRHSLKRFIRA